MTTLNAMPTFRPGMSRERFIEALTRASPALGEWAKKNDEMPVDELYETLKGAVRAVEGDRQKA